VIDLAREDFNIEVQDFWGSAESGAEYPSLWRIEVPEIGLQLQVQPLISDQEMILAYTYWEGAVDATGTRNGGLISGIGFVEMTGYANSFAGEF
jgi:predicted secreted hydrolase